MNRVAMTVTMALTLQRKIIAIPLQNLKTSVLIWWNLLVDYSVFRNMTPSVQEAQNVNDRIYSLQLFGHSMCSYDDNNKVCSCSNQI